MHQSNASDEQSQLISKELWAPSPDSGPVKPTARPRPTSFLAHGTYTRAKTMRAFTRAKTMRALPGRSHRQGTRMLIAVPNDGGSAASDRRTEVRNARARRDGRAGAPLFRQSSRPRRPLSDQTSEAHPDAIRFIVSGENTALFTCSLLQFLVALQCCELTEETLPRRVTTADGGRQTADERRETAVCGAGNGVTEYSRGVRRRPSSRGGHSSEIPTHRLEMPPNFFFRAGPSPSTPPGRCVVALSAQVDAASGRPNGAQHCSARDQEAARRSWLDGIFRCTVLHERNRQGLVPSHVSRHFAGIPRTEQGQVPHGQLPLNPVRAGRQQR